MFFGTPFLILRQDLNTFARESFYNVNRDDSIFVNEKTPLFHETFYCQESLQNLDSQYKAKLGESKNFYFPFGGIEFY